MNESIKIAWLYPQELNLYGDSGNVTVLCRRLEWRSISAEVIRISRGSANGLEAADLVYMGGGQDAEQIPIAMDLVQRKSDVLRALASTAVPMLAVCAGYQLFGQQYVTTNGYAVPGVHLLPITTAARLPRLTGTVIGEVDCFGGMKHRLVGFENHAGRTELASGAKPLAILRRGAGNNGTDETEGAIQGSVVGTYLHGPVLSANPWLADALLSLALTRRGMMTLNPLRDDAEQAAAADFLRSR